MSNVFNTSFETSLRVLLTLEAAGEQSETSDIIAAADFITIYGRDFSIADENLHGDNNFKFSEFALLRELVNKAVKRLVVDGLINVSSKNNNGFSYSSPFILMSICFYLLKRVKVGVTIEKLELPSSE